MSRLVEDVNKRTSPRKDGNNGDAKKRKIQFPMAKQPTLEIATKAQNYAVLELLIKLKSVSFAFP